MVLSILAAGFGLPSAVRSALVADYQFGADSGNMVRTSSDLYADSDAGLFTDSSGISSTPADGEQSSQGPTLSLAEVNYDSYAAGNDDYRSFAYTQTSGSLTLTDLTLDGYNRSGGSTVELYLATDADGYASPITNATIPKSSTPLSGYVFDFADIAVAQNQTVSFRLCAVKGNINALWGE